MAHFIIQDRYTGYIWGDTRDINGGLYHANDIVDACRALDQSIGGEPRVYEEVSRLDGDDGYIVYRVEVDGSEAVTVIWDGQSQETIDAVEASCPVAGYVQCVGASESV